MAKITVEGCLKHIPNRFDLIMLASKRAHQILAEGKKSHLIAEDTDSKPTVIALREIEQGLVKQDFFEKDAFDGFEQANFSDIDERLFDAEEKLRNDNADNIELI